MALAACRFGFPERTYEDACLPTSCTNNELVGCEPVQRCSHGCATTSPPHCLALAPSNGINVSLLGGAAASLTGANFTFDTYDGTIEGRREAGIGVIGGIGFYVVDEMGVFVVHDVDVPIAATWTAQGANAFVLFAADTIAVSGTIDAGAIGDTGGPHATRGGAGAPRTSCEGQNGPYKFSIGAGAGGGGGAGATPGGSGADTAADSMGSTSGGPGGTPCAQPSTTPPRGGNGGGPGGTENFVVMGGTGGGGGGAVALVAMIAITIDGAIAAPGDGGATIAGGSGGGGGGAGGAVFLESLDVTVGLGGAVTANGGGGGPATNPATAAARGQRGHLADAFPAAGGTNAGNGGTGTVPPSNGKTATGGGGGGGAVGMIEIRSLASSITGALMSPAPRTSQAALQ